MTEIIEKDSGLYMKHHKNKSQSERQISNFRINSLGNNYAEITANEISKIIQLSFPEELKLFKKMIKQIHNGLRFWGNQTEYDIFLKTLLR